MHLTKLGDCYVFECSINERFAAKKAGFAWNYHIPNKWATKDPKVACQLLEWADESCHSELREHKWIFDKTLEASRAKDANIDIPCWMNMTPLPFQRAGVKFILEHHNTLLADEMGLGKTIQVILSMNCLGDEAYPCLIVCPAVLKLNWKNELQKWLYPDPRKIDIIYGKNVPYDGAEIVIINYDLLSKNEQWLHGRNWAVVVADEAHALKTPGARRTKSFSKIKADRKIILTGTPILNRPVELYPILRYLEPAKWSNWPYFVQRYCGAHHTRFGFDVSGASNLDELNLKLRTSIMIRRAKLDVLTELPPKFRQVIEMPCENVSIIGAELEAYQRSAESLAGLKAAVQLARASDNPDEYRSACARLKEGITAAFSEMAKLRYATAMYKVKPIIAHLKELTADGPVICFAHHRDVINEIADAFDAPRIIGGIEDDVRQQAVEEFQDPASKTNLIVCSIRAAGVGITLTRSSRVVFAELDWTPAILSQAEDRAHRIGQKDNVLVQHFVLEGSLDARMAKMLVRKQEIIDHILDRDVSDEAVLPEEDHVSARKSQLERAAKLMTEEERACCRSAIRSVSALCDGARSIDGAGFSKVDMAVGRFLADASDPNTKQYALMLKIAHKYRGQLDPSIVDIIVAAYSRCFTEENHADQDQAR